MAMRRSKDLLFYFTKIEKICKNPDLILSVTIVCENHSWIYLRMTLLTILTLVNFVFILIFFVVGRSTRMTYTEVIVARKLGAYILTLLALVVICLLLLKETFVVQMIAYGINIILAASMIVYFFNILRRPR